MDVVVVPVVVVALVVVGGRCRCLFFVCFTFCSDFLLLLLFSLSRPSSLWLSLLLLLLLVLLLPILVADNDVHQPNLDNYFLNDGMLGLVESQGTSGIYFPKLENSIQSFREANTKLN